MRIGSKLDLASVIKLTKLENRIIDVIKMDIEGDEKGLIAALDMDYACKYFKQLVFESHQNFRLVDLIKLEACFRLFYRHTRFFLADLHGTPTGVRSELQQANFRLDLSLFGNNELNLTEFMLVNGELYFANINFLKTKS